MSSLCEMDSGFLSVAKRPELILSGFRVELGISVDNIRVLKILFCEKHFTGVFYLKPWSIINKP